MITCSTWPGHKTYPVIATGHVKRALRERGYTSATILPAIDARPPDCKAPVEGEGTGKGSCDLAIIPGLPYPMAWTLLPGSDFAHWTRTITLDNTYQPNANWSFGNVSVKDWQESLEAIAANPAKTRLTDV